MNETKSMFLSKGFMGGVATVIMGIFMLIGAIPVATVNVPGIEGVDPNVVTHVLEESQAGGATIVGVITIAFGILAAVGRLAATKRLLLLIVTMFCVIGCSEVQMSAQYRQALEQSTIVVGELDQRCQAGDNVACKEGLHRAAETLDLLTDAVHGVDSTKETARE